MFLYRKIRNVEQTALSFSLIDWYGGWRSPPSAVPACAACPPDL